MANAQQQAWQALRRTRRLLPHPLQRAKVQMPLVLGGNTIHSGKARSRRINTGYSIDLARKSLAAKGMDDAQIQHALHEAVAVHFRAFAGSWSQYVTANGWLHELLELNADERRAIIERCRLNELAEYLDKIVENPLSMFTDLAGIAQLTKLTARLQQEAQEPDNPVRRMLEDRHGLHPELALAVLKYGQAVPWWVLILLPVFAVFAGWVFYQALVNPQAEFFTNAGGVTWLHYTVLPLFTLVFIFVTGYLIKDRPLREREWREQLAKYKQAWREQVR